MIPRVDFLSLTRLVHLSAIPIAADAEPFVGHLVQFAAVILIFIMVLIVLFPNDGD